jgi:hypothetical protein
VGVGIPGWKASGEAVFCYRSFWSGGFWEFQKSTLRDPLGEKNIVRNSWLELFMLEGRVDPLKEKYYGK